MDRIFRLRRNGEAEARGETQSSEHAQGILRKPLHRVSDAADDPLPEILHPAEAVDHCPVCVGSHRVDREVTARQIIL